MQALASVNQELRRKVSELESSNKELNNLLASSEVPTLRLDRDLRIKWFSPAARNVLGLIASDVARPVGVFRVAVMGESLIRDARSVLADLAPVQSEVKGDGDHWFLRRMLPYRTEDKRVDGVIITFTDITEGKRVSEALVEAGKVAAAGLEARVQERTSQLRGLAFELTRAEESERQAIARRGFGLTSVRERMSFIGGSIEISSVPGDGTEAVLLAPLQTREQEAWAAGSGSASPPAPAC